MRSRLICLVTLIAGLPACLNSQINLASTVTKACDSLSTMVYIEPPEAYDTIHSIQWRINGTAAQHKEDTLKVSREDPGIYAVEALINNTFELNLATRLVVLKPPSASITDSSNTDGLTYYFRSDSLYNIPDYNYRWYINEEERGDSPFFIHSFKEAGEYSVKLVIQDQTGCTNSTLKRIAVNETLHCPNVFTPNMDGFNDYFRVNTDGNTVYDFRVFSRAGLKVYHTQSPTIQWDGRSLSGIEMQPGIYYYTIESVSSENHEEISGFVHMIR